MSKKNEWQTDYIAHETVYLKKKLAGEQGWATDDVAIKNIQTLEKVLSPYDILAQAKSSLELGCGAGQLSLWLAKKGITVSGIDIAPTAIKMARENFQNSQHSGNFEVGSVLNLPELIDAPFDLIIDGHCLHCIIGKDRTLFFSEAQRMMHAGSTLIIKTMCGVITSEKGKSQFDESSRCSISNGVATRYFGMPDSILEEVHRAGFRIKHHTIIERDGREDMDELIILAESA